MNLDTLLSPWTQAFSDPMFTLALVVAQAVSMGVFLLAAVPLTYLAWRNPPSLARYRLQDRHHAARKQVGRAVRMWLLNNVIMFGVAALAWPWLRGIGLHAGPLPSLLSIALTLCAFVLLDDLVYYGMHRLLHTSKWLYRHVHAMHHRVTTPWAIAAHYMHPVEFVLTGALTLTWPLLFDAHVVTLWLWVGFRQLEAADGHSGYVLPWNPLRLFPFYDGAAYHDLHHARFVGNYAGFLPYLDRLLGTRSPGSEPSDGGKTAG